MNALSVENASLKLSNEMLNTRYTSLAKDYYDLDDLNKTAIASLKEILIIQRKIFEDIKNGVSIDDNL